MKDEGKSSCCGARYYVVDGDEGTSFYVCYGCAKDCYVIYG